jgi:two-component sensor histidine kinase/putative methionine-R-sulfoxide reductase with GAF domain
MVATDIELQTALRSIAERWQAVAPGPPSDPLGDGAPDDAFWSVLELRDILQVGEIDLLLAWLRRLGMQARRSGMSVDNLCGMLAGITSSIVQLAAAALGEGADAASLIASVGAPVQAAALHGYLGSGAGGASPSSRATPAPARGDVEGRLQKTEALNRINRAANASLHLSAMLDLVVEAVADVIGSDTCSIWTYHDETGELVLRAAHGLNPEAIARVRLKVGQAITGEVARTRKAIAAIDAPAHPAYQFIAALGEERYRSQVSVPIVRYSVDRLVGVLTLKTIEPRDFDEDDIRFLRTVASELAIAIENAQLYQQTDARLREKVRELATLQRVSARMAETLDLGEVLQIIAANAAELGGAQLVTIIRVDRDSGELETMASYGEEGELPEARAAVERELMREVVQKVTPMRWAQSSGMVGLTSAKRPADAADAFSVFAMPLRTVRGVLGGICLHYTGAGGPSDEQNSLLVSFANAAAIAIENARLYTDAQRNVVVSAALLQEMHHRVRNNLQQTSGLLRLQMRRISEPSAVAALRQSISRIQSIASIHDLLSRGDLGVTTVTEVAKRVADEASASLTPPGKHYRFHVAGSAPEVSTRQATLLAVVINEMIANAIRHGLRDRDEGDIWITGRVEGANVIVTVEDNGQGLPADFGPERETGLGLNIIRTLVSSDLGGNLTLANRPEGGACMTVEFPYRPRRARTEPD